jgi:hypothetical protein
MSESEQNKPVDRHPGTVAQEMITLVPKELTSEIAQLNAIYSNAAFRAPEIQGQTWEELSQWLRNNVGEPPLVEEWKIKIVALFMRKSEQEIREAYGAK